MTTTMPTMLTIAPTVPGVAIPREADDLLSRAGGASVDAVVSRCPVGGSAAAVADGATGADSPGA